MPRTVFYCLPHREKFETPDEVREHEKKCEIRLLEVRKDDQELFDTLIDDRPKIHTH